MELTQDRYLEHFGVKGMHWGVRRDIPDDPFTKSARKQDRNRKIAKAVNAAALGVTVGLGALSVGKFLANFAGPTVRDTKATWDMWDRAGTKASQDFMSRLGNRSVSSVQQAVDSVPSVRDASGAIPLGPGPRTQAMRNAGQAARAARSRKREFDYLSRVSDDLRRAADNDLRSLYDQNQTPLHLRQYLRDD